MRKKIIVDNAGNNNNSNVDNNDNALNNITISLSLNYYY